MLRAHSRLVTAIVVATLVASAAIGGAAAASNGSLMAAPNDPGATSTHTVTATAGSDATGSWNGLEVDYSDAGADASNVGTEDIATIGIDRDDDADADAIDVNVSDDLSSVDASNNGETLTFGLGGSYDVAEGDELVVVFENVQNPEEAGSYVTPLEINPQSSGGETTSTLTIGQGTSDDIPTTDGADDDATTDDSDTSDDGDAGTTDGDGAATTDDGNDDDDGSSGGFAPGFGLGVAVLALAGAALLAHRR